MAPPRGKASSTWVTDQALASPSGSVADAGPGSGAPFGSPLSHVVEPLEVASPCNRSARRPELSRSADAWCPWSPGPSSAAVEGIGPMIICWAPRARSVARTVLAALGIGCASRSDVRGDGDVVPGEDPEGRHSTNVSLSPARCRPFPVLAIAAARQAWRSGTPARSSVTSSGSRFRRRWHRRGAAKYVAHSRSPGASGWTGPTPAAATALKYSRDAGLGPSRLMLGRGTAVGDLPICPRSRCSRGTRRGTAGCRRAAAVACCPARGRGSTTPISGARRLRDRRCVRPGCIRPAISALAGSRPRTNSRSCRPCRWTHSCRAIQSDGVSIPYLAGRAFERDS